MDEADDMTQAADVQADGLTLADPPANVLRLVVQRMGAMAKLRLFQTSKTMAALVVRHARCTFRWELPEDPSHTDDPYESDEFYSAAQTIQYSLPFNTAAVESLLQPLPAQPGLHLHVTGPMLVALPASMGHRVTCMTISHTTTIRCPATSTDTPFKWHMVPNLHTLHVASANKHRRPRLARRAGDERVKAPQELANQDLLQVCQAAKAGQVQQLHTLHLQYIGHYHIRNAFYLIADTAIQLAAALGPQLTSLHTSCSPVLERLPQFKQLQQLHLGDAVPQLSAGAMQQLRQHPQLLQQYTQMSTMVLPIMECLDAFPALTDLDWNGGLGQLTPAAGKQLFSHPQLRRVQLRREGSYQHDEAAPLTLPRNSSAQCSWERLCVISEGDNARVDPASLALLPVSSVQHLVVEGTVAIDLRALDAPEEELPGVLAGLLHSLQQCPRVTVRPHPWPHAPRAGLEVFTLIGGLGLHECIRLGMGPLVEQLVAFIVARLPNCELYVSCWPFASLGGLAPFAAASTQVNTIELNRLCTGVETLDVSQLPQSVKCLKTTLDVKDAKAAVDVLRGWLQQAPAHFTRMEVDQPYQSRSSPRAKQQLAAAAPAHLALYLDGVLLHSVQ